MSVTRSATPSATTQIVAEWVKLFPRQVTETYTSSVTFMKQLTVIAISAITYLKNVVPEDSFTIESFAGVNLKILKKNCNDELAHFISTSLMQAFDAFEKRYLHQLALCFYDGACHADNLTEYHIFEFTYEKGKEKGGATLNVHSKTRDNVKRSTSIPFDDVRQRTIRLIRALVVIMHSCQNEINNYDISLRLYYNEDAPMGYQAPGFLSTSEDHDHLADTMPDAIKTGSVETPFHSIAARSYVRTSPSSHEAIASQSRPMMTQSLEENFRSQSPVRSCSPASRCQCGMQCEEGDQTLTCDYCGTVQHAACFGILDAARLRRHCCAECWDRDSTRVPTCRILVKISKERRQSMSVFRRALEYCTKVPSVGLYELADKFQLTHTKAAKLLKTLLSHMVVTQSANSDSTAQRKVDSEQLARVLKNYFQTDESNVVDRLLAETLSQGSQPDPVAAVLGPLHNINLQNENAIGKLVEHTPPNTDITEDTTLKQYREVLLSSTQRMDAELPLSGTHNPVKGMEKIGKKSMKRKMDEENRPLRYGMKTKRVKATRK